MKRRIAIEWLLFVGLAFVGLVVIPTVFYEISPPDGNSYGKEMGEFYSCPFDKKSPCKLIFWFVVLAPYILTQFTRSLIWAWKLFRSNPKSK
jgi:hypothetical protein